MMTYLFLFVILWCMPVVWADYQKRPGTRFDLGELTSEMKAVVPALEGCDDTQGVLTCRRLTGDFTPAEQASLDAAVTAHDPEVRTKRKNKLNVDRSSAKIKLKALGLTESEVESLRSF